MIFSSDFSFYSILLFCFVVPVELEKYDVIFIPVSSLNQAKRSKDIENIRPKRPNFRNGVVLVNANQFNKMDMEDYVEPTEMPDIDNFHYADRIENGDFERYGRSDGDTDFIQRFIDDYSIGGDKIVGGSEVEINIYPYHVGYGTNCGGAIIGNKWVMTAGHCGKKPYIRVGSKYLNQGRKISVANSHIHPQWSGSSKEHPFDFDFQILELDETLKYTDNIQPVKIARIEDMVIGKVITVTGWGNTEENGPYSNVLRAVRVPIISKENCQRVPFPYFRGQLTARMFCAGFQEGKKDACQGDSGGPAVSNERLLGMVSFGYGCATPGSYGVYSKVAKVRDWIQEVTGMKLE